MHEIYKVAIVVVVSALPWGEVLVAVPVGIGLGLSPPVTLLAALAGNVGSALALGRLLRRWEKVSGLFLRSRRTRWVGRVMKRYGIIGLSAQAPVISGAHAVVLLGLLAGDNLRSIGFWLTVSIAGWGLAITALVIQGKQLTISLWG